MSTLPNYVFVLDKNRKPLTPCKPSTARLLNAIKTSVCRLYPMTIRNENAAQKIQTVGASTVGRRVGDVRQVIPAIAA